MVEVLGGSMGSLNLGDSKGSRDRPYVDLSRVDAGGSLGLTLFLPEPAFQGSRSSPKREILPIRMGEDSPAFGRPASSVCEHPLRGYP
jgi:hypothetical protein